MANSKNPFAKLVSLQEEFNRTLQFLLEKGNPDEIVKAMKEIQEHRKNVKVEENNLIPPTVMKIQKLLIEYPGFQTQMLETLNTSIKSAEKMEILDRYKAKPGKDNKKAVGKKKADGETNIVG